MRVIAIFDVVVPISRVISEITDAYETCIFQTLPNHPVGTDFGPNTVVFWPLSVWHTITTFPFLQTIRVQCLRSIVHDPRLFLSTTVSLRRPSGSVVIRDYGRFVNTRKGCVNVLLPCIRVDNGKNCLCCTNLYASRTIRSWPLNSGTRYAVR